MKKISEHRIEQYIRFPEGLSSDEIHDIQYLIENSREARKIYDFLKRYYQELDKVGSGESYVIPLKIKAAKSEYSGPVVLAAKTPDTPSASLVTKATLVSEAHKTVVRILENKQDQSLQFHVVGSSEKQSEHVILSILQPEIDLVTDKFGKLKGVRELSDIKWGDVPSVLRFPRQKVSIDPKKNGAPINIKPNTPAAVHVNIQPESLMVTFVADQTTYSRMLMIQGDKSDLIMIDQAEINVSIKTEENLTLYFYE